MFRLYFTDVADEYSYSPQIGSWRLIGRSAGPNTELPTQQSYTDALRSALGDLLIPVIYDVDIGHIPPQMTLVNGAQATVIFENHRGSITQHL